MKTKASPRIIGKYYILTHIIQQSDKGIIYQAISLKNFCFRPCVIKQGRPGALLDQQHRDIKHRLLWQRKVLTALGNSINTPAYVDYFEDQEYNYLVLQYVEGTMLYTLVRQIFKAADWDLLKVANQIELLQIYLQIVTIVSSIHEKGFVHRDLTDSNFIMLKEGGLCILDFELSYSIVWEEPQPPFALGTYGYMSPEQLKNLPADYSQDIYSLGALLCFILTKIAPKYYLKTVPHKRNLQLRRLSSNKLLNQLVADCLSLESENRPALTQIKNTVETCLAQLKSAGLT